MKRQLFYSLLSVYIATAVITLLGVIGVFSVSGGILGTLVTALLVQTAGAVIALSRSVDVFGDDEQVLAATNAGLERELRQLRGEQEELLEECKQAKAERDELGAALSEYDCARNEVLALVGPGPVNIDTICSKLQSASARDKEIVLQVIGRLVEEGKIEADDRSSIAREYRLKVS